MFTNLSISNFKTWERLDKLRLAPITVFFGANSSGKSSIGQLLLMLKQTAESPDRKRVLHFGDPKSLVDVGTYQDVVFNHEVGRSIGFSFSWTLPGALHITDTRSDESYVGDSLTFRAEVGQDQSQNPPRVLVNEFDYSLTLEGREVLGVGIKRSTTKELKYDLAERGYVFVRSVGRVWRLPQPTRFYGFPDEAVAYWTNAGFLRDLTLELEKQLARVSYLGPLREEPERTYVWSGEQPESSGSRGQRAVEAILSAGDRRINKGRKQAYHPFQQVIANWLKQLGIIDSFVVQPIARNRKEYEVRVRTSALAPEVLLPDVGFGISQVLPVVVQCFYANAGSTVIMEQPEIHLHPSVQASLADLFAEAIHSRENGEDRRIQLLIESHSEHFLRRLQRLIADEVLLPSEVAVYFCSQDREAGSKIEELVLDEYGRISNWPANFFGNLVDEVAAQTRSMLNRMES